MIVACLYVDSLGVYSEFCNVELWCKDKDARRYRGPHPVVAHPPCNLWGRMAKVNYKRWGGDHNKPGNDEGCFASALESVRAYGGVLEHPKSSAAFNAFGIPKPKGFGWNKIAENEWVCEVWQSAYGHRCAKATWLFYCGKTTPKEMRWNRFPGTHQISFDSKRKNNKPVLFGRAASATPKEFAITLIDLARLSS